MIPGKVWKESLASASAGRFTLSGRRNPSPSGVGSGIPRKMQAAETGLENRRRRGTVGRMHGCGRWLAALVLLAGAGACPGQPAAGAPADLARRVVLLANAASPDSLRVARHYAARRGVPAANIIALPMSREETIGWPEFIATIYQPLQDQLVARGWIDAIPTSVTDALGRKRYGVFTHHLSYLVVCRGVPLRVSHDPAFYRDEPRLALRPEFRTNQGAVDSELTLLAHSTYNINGWVPNPLFRVEHPFPFEAEPVVKVTRLDGPTEAAALGLVDRALAAERTGLLGRYYVDQRGTHTDGDEWLDQTLTQLQALGFDGDVNRAEETFPAGARFDAPVLYFGWHAADLDGPMALPGFRFPPGAIALHIHSFSAQTLRSATSGWCGPLVARGVTATFGNVFEPYLQLTLEPQLLVRALVMGMDLGDAAYFAEPALSWQTIIIGDPLYRPFAVTLDEQLARLRTLPPALAPYAVLRQARLWEQAGKATAARDLLQASLPQWPGWVLALALAERREAAGDRPGAMRALESVPVSGNCTLGEVPLASQAAQLLVAGGSAPRAVAVYQAILRTDGLTRDRRAAILRDAIGAAMAAADRTQARAWEREFSDSLAPSAAGGKL
jgi:uncharacterized protein (TIGR03790 family)